MSTSVANPAGRTAKAGADAWRGGPAYLSSPEVLGTPLTHPSDVTYEVIQDFRRSRDPPRDGHVLLRHSDDGSRPPDRRSPLVVAAVPVDCGKTQWAGRISPKVSPQPQDVTLLNASPGHGRGEWVWPRTSTGGRPPDGPRKPPQSESYPWTLFAGAIMARWRFGSAGRGTFRHWNASRGRPRDRWLSHLPANRLARLPRWFRGSRGLGGGGGRSPARPRSFATSVLGRCHGVRPPQHWTRR